MEVGKQDRDLEMTVYDVVDCTCSQMLDQNVDDNAQAGTKRPAYEKMTATVGLELMSTKTGSLLLDWTFPSLQAANALLQLLAMVLQVRLLDSSTSLLSIWETESTMVSEGAEARHLPLIESGKSILLLIVPLTSSFEIILIMQTTTDHTSPR